MQGRRATRFIIKGPRGGGKSFLLGLIGFVQWLLQSVSIVDMGGSLAQAKGVYNYFVGHIERQPAILAALPDDPTMQETKTDKGNYFKAVAASSKAVRGPHPDHLFIDEAAETKTELIHDAMPMVSSSSHQLVVMTSTFHKVFGFFQETWDEADALGWVRLSWDTIDVCKTFNPDHFFKDERLIREIPDLTIAQAGSASLEARVAGRTGDPDGWIPFDNMVQQWREKPTLSYFDVEYMGSRPSAEGMVNDPEDVDACIIDDYGEYAYIPNTHTAGGLDWGFAGMTSWVAGMKYKDDIVVQLEQRNWSQVRSGVIIGDIVKDVLAYRIRKIHADASHAFENKDLRIAIRKAINLLPAHERFGCTVVEIPFGRPVQVAENNDKKQADGKAKKKDVLHNLGTEKEFMLGNYRAYFSRRLFRIMRKCKTAIWQHKRYRYQENSDKPVKEDDHIPDATMLMQREFVLGKFAGKLSDQNPKSRRGDEPSTHTGGLISKQF